MGVDLRICLIKDKRKSEVEKFGMSRGFCNLVGNAKYADRANLTYLEKVVNMDLSFLLEPEYDDPSEVEFLAKLRGENTKGLKREISLSNTFLKAEFFLERTTLLYNRWKEIPDNNEQVEYFNKSWRNDYFSKEFLDDLDYLTKKLSEMIKRGYKWVSIEIAH